MQFITPKPEGGLLMKTGMMEQMNKKNSLVKLMGLVLATALVTNCAPTNSPYPANSNYDVYDSSGIIGGTLATSQFQKENGVVQLKMISKQGQATCTGTLIARNVVMTAAHCVTDPDITNVAVVFALTDKGLTEEKIIFATDAAVHSDYIELKNPETVKDSDIWNDIALVKLSKDAPVDFKLAQLPTKDTQVALLKGHQLTLSGYGITNAVVRREIKLANGKTRVLDMPSKGSGTLRKVEQIVVTNVTDDQKEITLDQTKLRGACHGDSGGPAFIKLRNGSLLQVGVTSRGTEKLGNCNQGAIYTGVIGQIQWIHEKVAQLNAVKKDVLAIQ